MTIILKNNDKSSHYPKQTEMACTAAISLRLLKYFSPEEDDPEKEFKLNVLSWLQKLKTRTVENLLSTPFAFFKEKIVDKKIYRAICDLKRTIYRLTKQKIPSDFYNKQKNLNISYPVRIGICMIKLLKPVLTKIEDALKHLFKKISVKCYENHFEMARQLILK